MQQQQQQQQQECLISAAPRRKKEALPSPWWDFFGNCKEAADSSDEEDTQQKDDTSCANNYDDILCTTADPTISANDDLIIKESAPLSQGSIVRTTPVKLISARSNGVADGLNNSDGEAVRPDTPGTHDSSFSFSDTSSSCSSFSDNTNNYDNDDDGGAASSFHSIGVDMGDRDSEQIEVKEERNLIGGNTTPEEASSPLKTITISSAALTSPPSIDTTQFIKEQQPLQSISEEEDQSNTDDESNFIGNIDVTAISPFLSAKQRNIRKNAYDLLKRLGDEASMFDLNSVEAEVEREEDNYAEQRRQTKQQQQIEVFEEVDGLKRQLGECNDMVVQLYENLRSYSNDATATNNGNTNDDDNENDDTVTDLHNEIANLKSQLQSAMLQSTQDASQIQCLEAQLQQAHDELSHHLNKQREYEETIDSVNEAVARSYLYNQEISKELMVSRKENDNLTMRLLDNANERDNEEKEEEVLSLVEDTNSSPATITTSGDDTDEVLEASFADDEVNGNDNVTTVNSTTPDAPARLVMTCDPVSSVFHHRQHPLSVLQDHLLSCIKLPLRVASILFSVWIAVILIRIVLIFSLIFVDHSLEETEFNSPGIY